MLKLVLNKFKLKQVILSSFVLLVSFAAALTATFAWFTVNRNVHGSSDIIDFTSGGITSMDITYYQIFDLESTTENGVDYINYYFN